MIISDLVFNQLLSPKIPENAPCKITEMQHILECQYLEKRNSTATIKKLDKDRYIVVKGENLGEIREFQHIENRSDDKISLSKTFRKLRHLINNNFSCGDNELFITLTYAERMTDVKQLYLDCNRFFTKLKYYYRFEYLCVVEPQGDGKKYGNEWHSNTWHCHILMKFPDLDHIFIKNEWLREKWGHGFVNVHKIKSSSCDNLGAYLTAYLADIPVDDVTSFDAGVAICNSYGCSLVEKDILTSDGKKVKKRIIKGGRLHLYPPGTNLYRKSKGIVFPDSKLMAYKTFRDTYSVGSAKPRYTRGTEMSKLDESGVSLEHFNTLIYEEYNLHNKCDK